MQQKQILLWSMLSFLISFSAFGVEQNSMIGYWVTQSGAEIVQVSLDEESNEFSAKIVWLLSEHKSGRKKLRDLKNPNAGLKLKFVNGSSVFSNVKKGSLDSGFYYDYKTGKRTKLKLKLVNKDRLQLISYNYFALFGSYLEWQRVEGIPRGRKDYFLPDQRKEYYNPKK